MLEYQKMILNKVCFNKQLFRRELEKSFKWLDNQEIDSLSKWVASNFKGKMDDVIEEVLSTKAA